MKILPINKEVLDYLKRRGLLDKFKKQTTLFEQNLFHPSLETELLEPKIMKIWSFRIDKKYRALFIFINKNTIEIIEANNHYK